MRLLGLDGDASWYRCHPYSVYPRGNAQRVEDITDRFGTLSSIVTIRSHDQDDEHAEAAYLDVVQNILSFLPVPDICQLSATCTGWYVMTHCTDAFRTACIQLSPGYLKFRGSWKESAIRAFLEHNDAPGTKRRRGAHETESLAHTPVALQRSYFCDQMFHAWICTLLPPQYPLKPIKPSDAPTSPNAAADAPQYRSLLQPVPRCQGLTPERFVSEFEEPRVPVIMTDVVTSWPLFKILQRDFQNLSKKKEEITRDGAAHRSLRCEFTEMSIDDYVQYASQQRDERPIYMFDAEYGKVFDVERMFTVPEHFSRDDFFSVLGERRPQYSWVIAGPHRGGSSFHVDPNFTHAWNANLTGRKRWFFFPPSCPPPGVVPSNDMAEVATPVSLTEWLLNHYEDSVRQHRHVGYECVCEPGDLIFIPCGWWHSVINLEDSVAITQNYVSRTNLLDVLKFMRAMKSSITGLQEEVTAPSRIGQRRSELVEGFSKAMTEHYPDLMQSIEEKQREEKEERDRRRFHPLPMLPQETEGFSFNF